MRLRTIAHPGEALSVIALALTVATGAAAQPATDRLLPAVIFLESYDEVDNATGFGSGFLIDGRGYAITNHHVIALAYSAVATLHDGRQLRVAQVLKADPASDLALIRLESVQPVSSSALSECLLRGRPYRDRMVQLARDGFDRFLRRIEPDLDGYHCRPSPPEGLPSLEISHSTPVLGEPVTVIGHPRGYRYTVTTGKVTAVRENFEEVGTVVQIDAAMAPGNSGGPILNARGEVIAVTAFFRGASLGEGLHFGVHTSELNEFDVQNTIENSFRFARARAEPDRRNPLFSLTPILPEPQVAEWSGYPPMVYIYRVDARLQTLERFDRGEIDVAGAQEMCIKGPEIPPHVGQFLGQLPQFRERQAQRERGYFRWYLVEARCRVLLEGSLDGAIAILEQGIHAIPHDSRPRLALADALMETDRYEEAIEHLEQVVARQPLVGYAWFLLGKAYLLAGDRDQAIAILNGMRRDFPDEAAALRALLND